MSELQVQEALAELRKHSKLSLTLVLLGALFLLGSIIYSATRLSPLEAEIATRRAGATKLANEEVAQRQRMAELQKSMETLKTNAEKLYSVRVTPSNQIYELKATAQATGRTLSQNRPEYKFAILVNSSAETLASIKHVKYHFEHETFEQKDYVSEDQAKHFAINYKGWGCLSTVGVTIEFKDDTNHKFDFSMCRSLGPQWE